MTDGTATWSYTYNADGLRTQRTNGTTTYNYVYLGGQLVKMTVGENTMYFAYDADGTPLSVRSNGTTYYYVTNLQGDVVGIVTSGGRTVVQYTYDAWGNPLSITGEYAGGLGARNPLRYRGYVYDKETGLYYLQSRYYDPEMGRFINADAFAATGQGILGNNMFAYCLNNVVVFSDTSGSRAVYLKLLDGGTKTDEENSTDTQDSTPSDPIPQDSSKNGTIAFGGTVSASGGGVAESHSAGITFDRNGNIGFIVTHFVGGGSPTSSKFSGSAFVTTTNAPNIYYQSGYSGVLGGSANVGSVNIGVEYAVFADPTTGKPYHGGTVVVGKSAGSAFEMHAGASYSKVYHLTTVSDLVNSIARVAQIVS